MTGPLWTLAFCLAWLPASLVLGQATYDAPPVPQVEPLPEAVPSTETPPASAPQSMDNAPQASPETGPEGDNAADDASGKPDANPAADSGDTETSVDETDEPADDVSLDMGVGFATDAHMEEVLLGKTDPNLDDLRSIQSRVNTLVERLRPAVVGIRMRDGQGSGVIVTSDGYMLTAAHVVGETGQRAQVVMPDGSTHQAIVLGTDAPSDSGMLRMLDKGPWPYVPVGESGTLNEGQWVMALGHPGGFDPERSSVVRVGRMLTRPGRTTLQTDCTLVGGDSGGPLFDLDGYVIGIHSRISRQIQQNYHVAVDVFTSAWDEMSADPQLYFGFSLKSRDETEKLIVSQVDGPVARAGMKVGDQLLKFDGKTVETRDDIRDTFSQIDFFDTVEVVVRRKVAAKKDAAKADEEAAEESEGESKETEQESGADEDSSEPSADEAPADEEDGDAEYEEITLEVVVGTK